MEDEDIKKIARKVLQLRQDDILEQKSKRSNDEELKKIAKLAISEMMTTWGVDVKEPLEMQEDFAWTRKYRKNAEKAGSAVFIFLTITIAGGIVGLIAKSLWKEK